MPSCVAKRAAEWAGLRDTPPPERPQGGDAATRAELPDLPRDRVGQRRLLGQYLSADGPLGYLQNDRVQRARRGGVHSARVRAQGDAEIILWLMDNLGLDLAAGRFRDYLGPSRGKQVKDQILSREETRAIEPFGEAEEKNRRALPVKIVETHQGALLALGDGEQVTLDRIAVAETFPRPSEEPWPALTRSGPDFILAFGGLSFDTFGTLVVERRGDVFFVKGIARHGFSDKYDFHVAFRRNAKLLESGGMAATFTTSAGWHQAVEGTFRIVGGKLVDPRFRWTDVETGTSRPHDR